MNSEHPSHETKVLVSAGSKHGSTTEIAWRIAKTLNAHGCDVTTAPPEEIGEVEGFDAVVLGSAVYAGHWTQESKALADKISERDDNPAVWLFSSGPVGDPPKPDEDPVDVSEVMASTSAREHRLFAGKLDRSKLNFGEKAIVVAVRAQEGDFRDWDAIDDWSRHIAGQLTREVSGI
jgi:menaquinone-dependent protoporphyrinogen oxidase